MAKVKYNIIVDLLTGALDSKKSGQMSGRRLVSRRPKNGGDEHQIYFMTIHQGKWAEGAVRNREIMKAAMRKAHAIEKAANKPAECTDEMIAEARIWQEKYATYRAELKKGEKGYASLYTYAYTQLYKQMREAI